MSHVTCVACYLLTRVALRCAVFGILPNISYRRVFDLCVPPEKKSLRCPLDGDRVHRGARARMAAWGWGDSAGADIFRRQRLRGGLLASLSPEGRCARVASAAHAAAFLVAVIMPYRISPLVKARCMTSRHHESRSTLYHRRGRRKTGHGSHTPAQMEWRHAGMVCFAQSSVTTWSSTPVLSMMRPYSSIEMKYGCDHSPYK
mmetsp:Transcript_46351/g.143021  ORF Transcript_46351/g.143021 Transcript_46351/m.143021 type:complete len:202 (-) Transcript_46351:813-1418(-)